MPSPYRKYLTSTERNLLTYIMQHHKKYPQAPCLIPQDISGKVKDYLRAIDFLEDRGYISVHRPHPNYRSWIAKLLKHLPIHDIQEEKSTQFR